MTRDRLHRDECDDPVVPHDGSKESGRDASTLSPSTALELLGDEHTRDVLHAISDRPRNASEIADVASVSKPTVYRRLNRLEDAGLVTSQLVLDPDGNHHKRYTVAFEEATFRLDDDDLSLEVEVAPTNDVRDGRERDEPRSALVS